MNTNEEIKNQNLEFEFNMIKNNAKRLQLESLQNGFENNLSLRLDSMSDEYHHLSMTFDLCDSSDGMILFFSSVDWDKFTPDCLNVLLGRASIILNSTESLSAAFKYAELTGINEANQSFFDLGSYCID